MLSFLDIVAQRDARARANDAVAMAFETRTDALPLRVVVTLGANDRDPTAEVRSQVLVAALNDNAVCARFASRYQATCNRPATLSKLMLQHDAGAALVVDSSGTHLKTSDGAEFKMHGGLGVLRVRRVLGGGNDTLVGGAREVRQGHHAF